MTSAAPRAPQATRAPRRRRRVHIRERLLKPAVFIAALVPLTVIVWGAFHDKLGANPIREMQIRTGLWTLRFLAITLAVTPLRRLTHWNWLIKYRRMLGLFTFFYACVHLSVWVGVDWFFDWHAMGEEIVKHKYILIGMLTFVLLIPLALTSTKGWVRRLGGARWNRLHQLIYVCAVTGTIHYLWAVKKDTFFPLVYLILFALLLGVRAQAWLSRRAARAATAGESTGQRHHPGTVSEAD